MTVRRRRSDRSGRSKLHSPGRPDSARREELVRFWAAIATGRSSEDAARDAGVSPPVGSRWTNAVLSHELGDRALRGAKAAGFQLGMDPRRAVAPLALLEDLPDLGPEPATPGNAFSSLWGRTPPGVEPAVSNPQNPAHEPDGVL